VNIQGRWAVALLATLAISLSANLFVGGWAVGRSFEARGNGVLLSGPGDEPHGRAARGVGRFLEGLPAEARPAVRTAFQARRAELRERLRAVRAARHGVAEAIARPDATTPQIESALAELRAREGELQATAHAAVASAVAGLPPEVRAQWRGRWKTGP
jgi:uncharacterized membrane protein